MTSTRTHQSTTTPPSGTRYCPPGHVEHADQPREAERRCTHHEATAGEGERRHVVVDVVGEQEVEHEADGSTEPPEHPDDADVRAPAHDVEDEEQPGHGERHPGEREAVRACRWRSQSQPTMSTGEVLEQQGHPDRQVRHGVEVRELAAGDTVRL